MFQPRANHRRHGAASTHRLGVESMEGRLMLAATALEFAPVELPIAQFAVVSLQQNAPPAGPAAALTQPSEGGFITNQFSTASTTGLPSQIGSAWDGVLLSDLIYDNGSVASASSDFVLLGRDFGGVPTGGTGLQPTPVLAAENNAGVPRAFDSNVVQYRGSLDDSHEGGPISIPVILANKELDRGPQIGPARGVKSLAAQVSRDAGPSLRLAASMSSDHAISGEWARAIVFEMAGSEPDGVGQSAAGARDQLRPTTEIQSNPQVGEPLSSGRAYRPTRQDVGQSTGAAKFSAAVLQATYESDRSRALMLGETHSADSGGNTTANPTHLAVPAAGTHAAGTVAGATGQGASATSSPNSALEAAFDEIGGSARSAIQTLASDSWRRSLGAAPLLMVLALERIAMGNSRRNRRDAVAVPARRPQLNRVAADAERA